MWNNMLENPWILGSPTFGGNPLSCSAAIAAIKYTVEWDIPRIAAEKGDYIMEKLAILMNKYPAVLKAVRGRGLLIGMEFPTDEIGFELAKGLFDQRVLVGGTLNNARVIRIEPPAIISMEQIDTVLTCLEKTLTELQKKHG
jgi:putrescine aminotransferase